MKDLLLKLIRKPLFWALLAVATLSAIAVTQSSKIKSQKADIERYQVNHETLLQDLQNYQSENGRLVSSVQALTLRADELETLIPSYTHEISQLKLKVRDLQSVAHLTTVTEADILAPIDTVRTPNMQHEYTDAPPTDIGTPPDFFFEDNYITVRGTIHNNQIQVSVEHRDSLTLVAHRKARKCLFKRKGKIIGYNVLSKSPYTKITNLEYIELTE